MAKFNKDSFGGTLAVVIAVSLVCSVVVAGSAVGLKPIQNEQKARDKQSYILSVAGLLAAGTDIPKVYAERIEPRTVDLATGEYVEAPAGFDARAAAKKPEESININPEDDFAGLKTRAKLAEVYLVKDESGKVNQIVLPMHGNGLWSVMYGFVSVRPDGNTINGITYYEQGETPGLGGEIANPLWQQKFVGKKLYNEQGNVAIRVGKGAGTDTEHGVDGLSGATLTTKGVQGSFNYWFGENGYKPYLAKLKSGAE
ncbi:Na(+)-translocating NADH-quinone reductase subunit C [Neisseria animalis]|uniref:Na(+)-translocating NADH-quinone reductase subunit C n=1 Tax=Neisseria animalis TaxID=492 RepID=A0A5P3MTB9_NEIAN|nr:Na(+)-translocating NADH-quinone reductase subunit C [Neisseria animalis]QEY24325.1 Na(+)-translocating NADH-quinone reductase subunit C [Neisseria animalis]ROW32274.1 Na(+)-translocating NADH-quinone reductase subunit C [Neisseria animalis]VEE06782.1 Na(+)-translocating NADH-quinone reductase subunit C [Neisseria animalis]